jgi:serine/threonine protein kinase
MHLPVWYKVGRNTLLSTFRAIHAAGVLHGDIRRSNICISDSGEATIIDFSHAEKGSSPEEQQVEIDELRHILGLDTVTISWWTHVIVLFQIETSVNSFKGLDALDIAKVVHNIYAIIEASWVQSPLYNVRSETVGNA